MKLFDSIDNLTVTKYDQILSDKNLIHLIKDCNYFNWSNMSSWEIGLFYKLKVITRP